MAAHFNVWLLAGYPPSLLRRGETVLIAKEQGATSPEKHRPITISDIILRYFHKIVASRFEATLPWNARQKAFMKGDGVADSIWLLQTIIRQHQRTLQPLNIAFLDIKKAFDSVSHESLLLVAGRMGVPPPLLGYLGELYGDAWTCLRIGPDRSEPIKVSRGAALTDLSSHFSIRTEQTSPLSNFQCQKIQRKSHTILVINYKITRDWHVGNNAMQIRNVNREEPFRRRLFLFFLVITKLHLLCLIVIQLEANS